MTLLSLIGCATVGVGEIQYNPKILLDYKQRFGSSGGSHSSGGGPYLLQSPFASSDLYRELVIRSNLAGINRHNSRGKSWQEGITPMTALTSPEFQELFLNIQPLHWLEAAQEVSLSILIDKC